jgi:hypothetical protein
MAAKIVNMANPDEDETLCATAEEAEQALATMVEKFKSQGYRVDKRRFPNEDYPQYTVYDRNDAWIGSYTIFLQ